MQAQLDATLHPLKTQPTHSPRQRLLPALVAAATALATIPAALATSDAWKYNLGGNWNTGTNWTDGNVPGSIGTSTNTDTATFDVNLTADRTVTVDATRNLQNITFGPGNNSAYRYVLSSGSLWLTSGGTILSTGTGSHTDTISTPITLQGDGGSYTIRNDSTSSTRLIGINTITGVATTGNTTTLYLDGTNTGNNTVSGNITNGSGGGRLAVVKNGTGYWNLSAGSNSFGPFTLNEGTLRAYTFSATSYTLNGGELQLTVNASAGPLTINGDCNLVSGNVAVGGTIYFGNSATLAAGVTINVSPWSGVTGGTQNLFLGGGTTTAGTATLNITNTAAATARLSLQSPSTLNGTLTITGNGEFFANNAVGGGGGITLDATFTGTAILAHNNGYTGPTTINGGTLQLGTGGNTGNLAASSVITNNGSLIWNRINASGQTVNNGISGSGTVLLTGGGTSAQTNNVTFPGVNTYTGTTTVSFGTLSLSGNGTLTTSPIILNGSTKAQFSIAGVTPASATIKSLSGVAGSEVLLGGKRLIVGDATDTEFDGTLSGIGGAIEKVGTGILALSGTNTYTGTATATAGVLLATHPGALSNFGTAGRVVFNGGTIGLQVGGGGWTPSQVDTLLANATKTGGALGLDTTNGDLAQWTAFTTGNFGPALGLTKLGANTLTLNAANSYAGPTTILAGTLQVGNGGATGTLGGGNVVNHATLAFNRGDTATVGNAISGPGSLVQLGGGTTILTGGNSYGGTTTLSAGTLQIGNGGTTGTLGGGNVVNDAALAFQRSDSLTVGNDISGSGSLTQLGTGTLVLTGNNSYGGVTQVEAGRLLVNGVNSGLGLVTVEAGATLGGIGAITGNVNVKSGGMLAPGASPGILTIGGLDLESGSVFSVEINGLLAGTAGYDQLVVSGDSVNIATGTILNIDLGFQAKRGDTFLIVQNQGADSDYGGFFVSGTTVLSEGASFNVGVYLFDITYQHNGADILLRVLVPEPASLGLLAFGLLATLRRRR